MSNKIDLTDWFVVCDAEDHAQAVFPTENMAKWYLNKYGWSGWQLRQIAAGENTENLFLLEEEQHRRAEDDKN